eukprot:5405660-Prymnesium_polylepis.1
MCVRRTGRSCGAVGPGRRAEPTRAITTPPPRCAPQGCRPLQCVEGGGAGAAIGPLAISWACSAVL